MWGVLLYNLKLSYIHHGLLLLNISGHISGDCQYSLTYLECNDSFSKSNINTQFPNPLFLSQSCHRPSTILMYSITFPPIEDRTSFRAELTKFAGTFDGGREGKGQILEKYPGDSLDPEAQVIQVRHRLSVHLPALVSQKLASSSD